MASLVKLSARQFGIDDVDVFSQAKQARALSCAFFFPGVSKSPSWRQEMELRQELQMHAINMRASLRSVN